ncbi:MAG TPA: SusC/RagA family TonB-linked outer membrane protein [Gemmatimonadaceae bacterium]|nr:SusC/RagA family TonB-linked outer membrane protein [Gemmatimonadaceae bacterium]
MQRWTQLVVAALVAATSVAAQAQTGRITGTVTGSPGAQPLEYVTVSVAGTRLGATTGPDGKYTIVNVPAGTHQLRAQRIGFLVATQSVTVAAGGTATVDFSLTAQAVQLSTIVSVGYGTQERRTVTAAVSTVTGTQLAEIPTSDPVKALQGRVPGVEIVSSNNLPGAAMNIRIRGVRSMTASNDPLYVVDGIPIAGGIGDFNPANIESIDILKDASATAVYGSRGSNGVVLVTTKNGAQAGRLQTQFTFDTYYGASRPLQLVEMMNMQEYTEMLQAAARYQQFLGNNVCSDVSCVLNSNAMRDAYNAGIQTDWQQAILRTGQQKNFQAGLAGSTANTRFNLSGAFFDQNGLAIGQEFWRGNGALSVDHTMNRLRLGVTANISRSVQDQGAGDGLWGGALSQSGFGSPYDADGRLLPHPDGDAVAFNPLRTQAFFFNQFLRNRIFGSAFAEFRLLDGLNLRVNYGPDYTSQDNGQFIGPESTYPANQDSRASLRTNQNFAWTLDNLVQLNRDFGSAHHIDGTFLYGIQKSRNTENFASSQQLPYDEQRWYALQTGTNYQLSSNLSEWALESMMGRLSYTLLDRYTVSAAVRRDGSSRLAKDNRWATFPTFSAAWQIGDESFMQGLTWLNNLKLRASYGVTGNTAINPYQTQGALSRTLYNFGAGNGFGYGPSSPANPFLEWEKTYQTDVGLEFATLGNRLTGTVDVYRQDTKDLLMTRTLPTTSGYRSALQNIGETKNTGLEIGLSTVNLRNWHGIRWTTDVNWSTNDNEIVKLATADTTGCPANARPCDLNNGWFVGHPINISGGTNTPQGGNNQDGQRRVWYDYRMIGIWQKDQAAEAASFGSQFKPGEIRIADINGDGRITSADRVIIGHTYADWTGSVYNRFNWKSFDLSALATIKWGYTMYDALGDGTNTMQGRMGNIKTDYWTPENPSNTQPAPRLGGNVVPYTSTRAYRDGSHWRIRNITMGYEAPTALAGRIGADRIRLYATAQDPFFFSDYKGYDPENGTAGGAPSYRTLLIGANLGW